MKTGKNEPYPDVSQQLTELHTRLESLEQQRRPGQGIWIERVMHLLIIIGLIVAVIILAIEI